MDFASWRVQVLAGATEDCALFLVPHRSKPTPLVDGSSFLTKCRSSSQFSCKPLRMDLDRRRWTFTSWNKKSAHMLYLECSCSTRGPLSGIVIVPHMPERVVESLNTLSTRRRPEAVVVPEEISPLTTNMVMSPLPLKFSPGVLPLYLHSLLTYTVSPFIFAVISSYTAFVDSCCVYIMPSSARQ